MKLILLGAPGAGKGTQAAILQEKLEIPTISTGNILRAAIKNKTPIGMKAKSYMDAGQLVPDEILVAIIRERLAQDDCANGYILDGFPRTIPQAEALEGIADIDLVLELNVSDEVLINRLSGRRVCPACGATYHVNMLNGSTKCEKCGAELIQRKDDAPETVLNRLKVYHDQTQPLIAFYEARGKLKKFDGAKDQQEVYAEIMEAIGTNA